MDSSKTFRNGALLFIQNIMKKRNQKAYLRNQTMIFFNFFSNKKKVEYEKSAPNNLQKLGVRAYCEAQTW